MNLKKEFATISTFAHTLSHLLFTPPHFKCVKQLFLAYIASMPV